MPQIETRSRLPPAVRDPLVERMRDRDIVLEDLNQLRLWMESKPDVPDGPWYKEFGSFKLCGEGRYPKTFLLLGQSARGQMLNLELRQDNPGKTVRIRTTTASPDEASGATWALSNQDAARRPPPLL